MGLFDSGDTAKKIDYLESERKKLWEDLRSAQEELKAVMPRVGILEEAVKNKTSDYEESAKQSASASRDILNKLRPIEVQAKDIHSVLLEQKSEADESVSELGAVATEAAQARTKLAAFEQTLEGVTERKVEIDNTIADLDAQALQLKSKMAEADKSNEALSELVSKSDSFSSKIGATHTKVVKQGKEVADLHDEVFGYVSVDDATGDETQVSGLKAELDSTYSGLKSDIENLDSTLQGIQSGQKAAFETFKKGKEKEFSEVSDRIRSLLPDAMTAGLSSAYETKRESEEEAGKEAVILFGKSIRNLTLVSLIPVIVSLYSFFVEKRTLDQVIVNIPQVLMAILPIYVPLLWFAISASKRIKLAKRLTEEYAHKEVLSKTFEGLYTQVDELPDDETSNELRIKLLNNMVSVTSENPGRLISDYNTSDNPVVDRLSKKDSKVSGFNTGRKSSPTITGAKAHQDIDSED